MSNLTNQDKAYFLMASRGQHHINVSPSRTEQTIIIVKQPQPQTQVVYQPCGCSQCAHDNTSYNLELVKEGIKAPFEGIAEIIRACGGVESKSSSESSSTASADTSNSGTSCSCNTGISGTIVSSPVVSGYTKPKTTSDSIHDDLKLQLADLQKELNSLTTQKTSTPSTSTPSTSTPSTSTPSTSTPSTSTPSTSTPSTEKPDASDKASDTGDVDSSDIAKKWKKVDVGYSKAQSDAYSAAVRSGDNALANEYKTQLNNVMSKVKDGLTEINKALNDENITDDDKKILEAAKKQLENIKSEIDTAFKTVTPETDKPASTDKPTSSTGTSISISDARAKAREAQSVYNKNKTIGYQTKAIEAYNNWARAVLNDKNASVDEIGECINSMKVICSGNNSSSVRYLIDSNPSITDVNKKPAADLLKDLQTRYNVAASQLASLYYSGGSTIV